MTITPVAQSDVADTVDRHRSVWVSASGILMFAAVACGVGIDVMVMGSAAADSSSVTADSDTRFPISVLDVPSNNVPAANIGELLGLIAHTGNPSEAANISVVELGE